MPNILMKAFTGVAVGRRARKGVNATPPPSGQSHWWFSVTLMWLGLGLLMGCSGPSQQVLTAQSMSQMKGHNNELQNQLMVQATQASLASYKDYHVGTEDLLAIMIYGQDNLNREIRVNGQGEITMPLVGVVKVAGLTPTGIENRLEKLYNANYLVNPQITVTVKEYRHQRVAVTGAVAKPGSYEIIGPRTLLEVLALAGGFVSSDSSGAGDVVNVIRHQNAPDLAKMIKERTPQPYDPKTETLVINLHSLLSGQEPGLNIAVQNGDVVNVPFAGTAYVMGAVKKPGKVAVKDRLTISQAIALSGGLDPVLDNSNITIMRFDKDGKPISINTNLDSIIARKNPDIPLKDNDVVVAHESSIKKVLFLFRNMMPVSGGYTIPTY
jgi:polysaccharide export outer membrane protein